MTEQLELGDVERAMPREGRRLRFVVISIALLIASIDQTSVATALDAIGDGVGASVNWVAWTITIYQLGQVVSMPLAGRLSDSWGRRRTFLLCLGLFGISSLACSIAPTIEMLVLFRFLQALGGGGFLPTATGIVADDFGDQRDRAIGFFTSIFPLGALVGPVVGGVIVTYLGWRQIFLVNTPIVICLAIFAWRVLPRDEGTSARPSIDLPGVVLFTTTMIVTLLAVSRFGDVGLVNPFNLGLVLIAVVLGTGFAWRQMTADDPFLSVSLLRDRRVALMNLLNLLYGGGAIGMGALVPLYAAQRFDVDSLRSGTLLTARAIGMAATSALAAMMLQRSGYRKPMYAGFTIMGTSLLGFALVPDEGATFVLLAVVAGVAGIGVGLNGPAANNAILSLHPERISSVAGLRSMFRQLGAILAVAVTTAFAARSPEADGLALERAFVVFGVVLIAALPLVAFVPERPRLTRRR